MSNFWPSGVDLSDNNSPREILKVAQEDWHKQSKGIMELVLQNAISTAGNIMIIVHAKHVASNRTSTLFSVLYRPNNPYPVTIQMETMDLPDFLKRTYIIDSTYNLNNSLKLMQSQKISNPWVSDTPAEFREKLTAAFNEGLIKSIILNLATDVSDDIIEENIQNPEHLENPENPEHPEHPEDLEHPNET